MHYDLRDLERIEKAIDGLNFFAQRELLSSIGGHLEDSVVARIEAGGPGPDGTEWPEWSERYAKTRHSGHSLLRNDGPLLESVQYLVNGGDELEVGSNLEYAATHQYGDDTRSIPARPYLGMSPQDVSDVEGIAVDWLQRRVLDQLGGVA